MTIPKHPKIYHIVHVDRLPLIIADGCLWCDAEITLRPSSGATIGMSSIKQRRLVELTLSNYPDLHVGDCVPFYFCPRSVMLFLIAQSNHQKLEYRDGQGAIIHLEADLYAAVNWAARNKKRWVFTLSNAGARYFEDRSDLSRLIEIDWEAVHADQWSGNGIPSSIKEGKQAEFLMEHHFPWCGIERIGVHSEAICQKVLRILSTHNYQPIVEIKPEWYY